MKRFIYQAVHCLFLNGSVVKVSVYEWGTEGSAIERKTKNCRFFPVNNNKEKYDEDITLTCLISVFECICGFADKFHVEKAYTEIKNNA